MTISSLAAAIDELADPRPRKEPISMTDNKDLDGLVNDYLDHKESAAKHSEIADQLADQIAAILGVGGRHEVVPGVGVRVQAPAARFDPKRAEQVLTAEQLASISEAKPSVTLAKKMLPGALVEQCQIATGKPSVRVL